MKLPSHIFLEEKEVEGNVFSYIYEPIIDAFNENNFFLDQSERGRIIDTPLGGNSIRYQIFGLNSKIWNYSSALSSLI